LTVTAPVGAFGLTYAFKQRGIPLWVQYEFVVSEVGNRKQQYNQDSPVEFPAGRLRD